MKVKSLMIAIILASTAAAPFAFAGDPIDPVAPVKEINLAQVEFGK